MPDGPVHLADGRGGGRLVVEPGEAVPPPLAQVIGEHLVNGLDRHRWCGFLQPGQGGPVRLGDLRGQHGLEYRQRLPELHRAALKVAQDPENLSLCVPKTCATWAYAPRLAVGLVPRVAPGGQVLAWPGCDDRRLVGLKLIFLIVCRAMWLLRLSRRESWWKDAEILMLRHQLSVALRASGRGLIRG